MQFAIDGTVSASCTRWFPVFCIGPDSINDEIFIDTKVCALFYNQFIISKGKSIGQNFLTSADSISIVFCSAFTSHAELNGTKQSVHDFSK